jgi:hypothetical protein
VIDFVHCPVQRCISGIDVRFTEGNVQKKQFVTDMLQEVSSTFL